VAELVRIRLGFWPMGHMVNNAGSIPGELEGNDQGGWDRVMNKLMGGVFLGSWPGDDEQNLERSSTSPRLVAKYSHLLGEYLPFLPNFRKVLAPTASMSMAFAPGPLDTAFQSTTKETEGGESSRLSPPLRR